MTALRALLAVVLCAAAARAEEVQSLVDRSLTLRGGKVRATSTSADPLVPSPDLILEHPRPLSEALDVAELDALVAADQVGQGRHLRERAPFPRGETALRPNRDPVAVLIPAVGVMAADGALAILLNVSVYWLHVEGSPEMAGWVGTFTRLFQSFMSPVLLILFPITTYISIGWQRMTERRQLLLHKLFILMGFLYGIIVGGLMALAGPQYIGHMFKLSVSGDRIDVAAISLFMGAVIAQKAYTMLLYAVSEARFVSFGTAIISMTGVAIAWLASRQGISPVRSVDMLFFFMSGALPLLLLISGFLNQRAYRDRSVNQVR